MRLRAPGGINLRRMERRMRLGKHEDWRFPGDGTVLRSVRVRTGAGRTGDALHVVRVIPGAGAAPEHVEIQFDTRAPGRRAAAAETIAHCLSLASPLPAFQGMAAADGVLGPLAERFRGLRVTCDADAFEAGVKAIAGQQVTTAFADTLVRRLRQAFGDPVEVPRTWRGTGDDVPETMLVFPSAERLASAEPDELRAMGFTAVKARAIVELARAVAGGSLDLAELASLDDDGVSRRVTALFGLGRWTAECVMLFGLGRPDVLPAADLGLQNALRRRLGLESRPGEAAVRRMGEAWRPYRSLATLYLWESLQEPEPRPDGEPATDADGGSRVAHPARRAPRAGARAGNRRQSSTRC